MAKRRNKKAYIERYKIEIHPDRAHRWDKVRTAIDIIKFLLILPFWIAWKAIPIIATYIISMLFVILFLKLLDHIYRIVIAIF